MSAPAPPPDRARTAERWGRIDTLFHAALERPPEDRERFLRHACGDDRTLLDEVKSLLHADAQPGADTFERWAGLAAAARAQELPRPQGSEPRPLIGHRLSHYDILDQLGSGGMGEVYLARDCTLARHVAIKILPPDVADDPRRLDRFHKEACAASALSHPNVATVYELGSADGQPFIAMEYVEGRTLDALLHEGPLTLDTVLDLLLQVSAALAAAHEAGVTHRDIKPGNVMVTPRGVVKVLDFGLAKLSPATLAGIGGSADDAAGFGASVPGLVLGTIDYMSPEQALGHTVDHRSDLFSLGVLLYQLSTGVLPFRRHSITATLDAILHDGIEPPSSIRRDLPPSLDRVLARALAKAPDARYQSARELAADLDALRRHAEPTGAPARSPRRRIIRPRLLLAGASIVVAGATIWQLRSTPSIPPMVVPFTSFAGIEATPAFSPDGESLAFSWDGPAHDNVDVYVKRLGGEPVRLTSNPAADQFPAFSPDGRLIAFVRDRVHAVVVPAAGGAEREIGLVGDPRITFAPDGQSIAAGARTSSGAAGAGIVLIPLSGGAHRALTTPPPGSSDIAPAFSPDGSRLAFQRIPTTAVADIWVSDATGANAARITFDDRSVEGPVWTEDGRDLIFSSSRLGAGRLWRVPAAGGIPDALPDTGPGSTQPTVPRRGDRLAFVASLEDTNMWDLSIGPTGLPDAAAHPGTSNSSWLDGSPDFSRDGRALVFVSNRTGRDEIFLGAPDTVAARQLTDFSRVPASTVGSPRLSPDGTRVAFDARVRGNADIYIVATSGAAPQRLTNDPGADVIPVWSPDGSWLYFTSRRSGRPEIWRVPAGGGPEQQITTTGGFGAQFSLDGRLLLYGRDRVNTTLWSRPLTGGRETLALVDETGQPRRVVQFAFWRPTRAGIIYVERQPAASGLPARFVLQSFDRESGRLQTVATLATAPALANGGLAVSPDGRRILVTQLDARRADINLLQPYR